MRVYATKTTKPSRSDAHAFEVRQLDAAIVADHHVLNMSLAIDDRAMLAAWVMGQLSHETTRSTAARIQVSRFGREVYGECTASRCAAVDLVSTLECCLERC